MQTKHVGKYEQKTIRRQAKNTQKECQYKNDLNTNMIRNEDRVLKANSYEQDYIANKKKIS